MPNMQELDLKNSVPPYHSDSTYIEINQDIDTLKCEVQRNGELIRKLEAEQEALSLKCYEFSKLAGKLLNFFIICKSEFDFILIF